MNLHQLILQGHLRLFSKEISIQTFVPQSRTDGVFGNSDVLLSQIKINSSMTTENMEETLLHELIHIIDGHLCLGLTEQQTQALAVGLYDFLKQNFNGSPTSEAE